LIAHFGAAMNVGAQAVDVAMIPGIAVKRLEVLRDGAAAQYGSDAIAGVMNFILRDNSKGFEINAAGGRWMTAENGRGGEIDVTLSSNIGLPLTENGFINISAEYSNRPELSRGLQHESASDGFKGWKSEYGTGFDSDTKNTDNWQTAMNWGRPESNGFRSVWNAGLTIRDDVEAYSFGNYAKTFGEFSFFLRPLGKSGALTAIPINPEDPSEGNFSWGDTYHPLGFTPRLEGHGTDLSSVFGIRGAIEMGLNYDLSASYGSNYINYYLKNTLNLSWGPDSPHNFTIGDLQQAETNLNADFSYAFSEAINLAFGAEWREEIYTMYEGQIEAWKPGEWANVELLIDPEIPGDTTTYTAPGLAANGMPGTSPDAAGAFDRQNTAFYADVEWELGEALLLQVAGRLEDFSDFGTTSNYKVAGRYSLSRFATLRGGYSTGFRAPTPGQSFYTGIVTSFDGVKGTQVQEGTLRPTDALSVSMGGKALEPEKAVNTNFGITANLIRNLNLTFDMYTIKVQERIIKSRSLTIVGNPEFSELAFYTNALDTKTSGFDFVAVFKMSRTDISLALNHNATEVTKHRKVNGIDPISESLIFNIENNLPKNRITVTVVHSFGKKLSAMSRVNFYGETIDERGEQEKVDAISLLDIELRYNVSDKLNLVFGSNNVMNTFPNQIETRISQGLQYPRRTPIGYHGGMGYMRLMYSF